MRWYETWLNKQAETVDGKKCKLIGQSFALSCWIVQFEDDGTIANKYPNELIGV